jgi:hypothetical protein
MSGKFKNTLIGFLGCLLATSAHYAAAIGIGDVVDGGNYFKWQRVELPGTYCSDGYQYKFWVHDSALSTKEV